MPLRDRAQPKPRPTAEAFLALEQEMKELKEQVPLLYQRMMLAQQEADKKTASRAADFDREFEQINIPFRAWDPGSIITAKSLADEGDLERAADLWESCLSDDRIAAAMEQRINGLEGLPVRFTGDGEDVLGAISTDFWQMMTPGDRAAMRRWGLGVGICPVYVQEWIESADGRMIPVCEVWNPRFLRWRQGETFGKREWSIQTAKSQIRLADQPGRWFLFTPFSGANQRPWVDGIWYSTATWWLAKSFGVADLASFTQSHATPKWFLSPKEGAQIAPAEKAEAIRRLAALPQRSGMYVPAGFQIEQKESTSSSWQAIVGEIDLANKALTVRILGTDSTTDKESSYASTSGGMQLLYGKFRTDADAESAFWHDGPLQFWYLLNFSGVRKLQERRVLDLQCDERTGGYLLSDERARRKPDQQLRQLSEQIRAGDSVPWPTRDATPPQDMAAVADTQTKAAAALVQLTSAAAADPGIGAAIARIDVARYLERYFPMLQQDESGAQLEMEDETIIELGKGMTGSGWITINGTHINAEPGKPIQWSKLKKKPANKTAPSVSTAKPTDPHDIDGWIDYSKTPNASLSEVKTAIRETIEHVIKNPSISQIEKIDALPEALGQRSRESLITAVARRKERSMQFMTEQAVKDFDALEAKGIYGIKSTELKEKLDVARDVALNAKSKSEFDMNFRRPILSASIANPKMFDSENDRQEAELASLGKVPEKKGKKGKITIQRKTDDGDYSPSEIEATLYDGVVGVNKIKNEYFVTHVATGTAIASPTKDRTQAHNIAMRAASDVKDPKFWDNPKLDVSDLKRPEVLAANEVLGRIEEEEIIRSEIVSERKGKKSLEDLLEDLTDFPKQGDNEAVSLRNSGYAVFDPEYAADIRENWPEIWDAGGNDVAGTEHSGDDQYRRLKPVVARNGKPETDTELEAVKRREAWAARHFSNNRLAGVVALMKWFVVGKIGEKGMKDVMEAQKDRLKKRLEDRAPAILLQAPRDVRKPLHDALGFADDTVDAMAAATPDAMDDVTGQILKVLADSKDFTDAKRRMLDAFPTLDRTKLRDVLTGGMLIAQAMGHESVKREVSK